jgi:hypothetical protein
MNSLIVVYIAMAAFAVFLTSILLLLEKQKK